MNHFFDSLEGGSDQLQKKKRVTVYLILVTFTALVLVLATLLISSVVLAIEHQAPAATTDGGASGANPNATPSDFLATSDLVPNATNLIILDDDHPYLGTPSQLVLLETGRAEDPEIKEKFKGIYTTAKGDSYGTPEAAAALNTMLEAFYKQSKDNNLYVKAYSQNNSNDVVYATGEAFSLSYWLGGNDFSGDVHSVDTYNWIYSNAHKYGFIQLYPDSTDQEKASLLRYVGPHATYMKNKKLSLEEYIKQLRAEHSSKKPLSLNDSGKHSVYYISPGEAQMIPDANVYDYSVSTDNLGGLVVTYKKK